MGSACAYCINQPDDWGPCNHVSSQDKLKPYHAAWMSWPSARKSLLQTRN